MLSALLIKDLNLEENSKTYLTMLWGDFLSLYSQFYKVIMHENTNATNEGKIQM